MSTIVPSQRPKVSERRIAEILLERGVRDPVAVIGWPGWFADMGRPGNDRGIYDDAIVVATPTVFAAFNGNVDPVGSGWNPGVGKPYASLKPGVWRYHPGWHKWGSPSGHPAFRQAGDVTVHRDPADGKPGYEQTGDFGINIHRGSYNSPSSWGCQTIWPDQWKAFYALVTGELRRHHPGRKIEDCVFPYVLLPRS